MKSLMFCTISMMGMMISSAALAGMTVAHPPLERSISCKAAVADGLIYQVDILRPEIGSEIYATVSQGPEESLVVTNFDTVKYEADASAAVGIYSAADAGSKGFNLRVPNDTDKFNGELEFGGQKTTMTCQFFMIAL